MKKLLNTLYVLSEDAWLSLKGEAVEVLFEDGTVKHIPLLNLEAIVSFSYKGASPALMGKCAQNNIQMSFFTPYGKYLASVSYNENGNVLLRRKQYRMADDEKTSLNVSKAFISGKLYNSRYVLHRYVRDHPLQVDVEKLKSTTEKLCQHLKDVSTADTVDLLRGIEGKAAADYFSCFDELILQSKDCFIFNGRNRHPPTDKINAMLSFAYTLLENECSSALRSVGIDPFVGFMHTDRPGRRSLALDMMEELREVVADKFVLNLVNNRIINEKDFETQSSGAVLLTDDGRKKFIGEWQKRKQDTIVHPFLKEKVPWGLVPYVQALLLSRFIRGDIDGYPPFFWK